MFTHQERQLDVSALAIGRLLRDARAIYQAVGTARPQSQSYWDGYIRALEIVLEMENE